MRKIKFTYHTPGCDRRHFVDEEDVKVVLGRLPEEAYARLRAVHFNDRSRGGRVLGYVNRGRREVAICAQPPRMSIASSRRDVHAPKYWGAVRGCQWLTLAIRRRLLYGTFMHELGHFQIIDEKAKDERRKFAVETKAEEFQAFWCTKLWSQPFDHPDPVHNPPSIEEIDKIDTHWTQAHAEYRKGLRVRQEKDAQSAFEHFMRAIEIYGDHSYALEQVGLFLLNNFPARRLEGQRLLCRALSIDPLLYGARQAMQIKSRAEFFKLYNLDDASC